MPTVYIRFSIRPEAARQGSAATGARRAPVLERLLSLALRPVPTSNWRRDAFAVINASETAMPAVAACALVAARGRSSAAFTCVATPLCLAAGMSTVTLAHDGILSLEASDAEQLAADFNRRFEESGTTLSVGRGAILLCEFDRPLEVATHDPERLLTHEMFDSQPTGLDAAILRRLMSEMEMWLFEHPVNRDRVARHLAPITSLWLWGGGVPLAELPSVQGWTAGIDPFFAAFGARGDYPSEAGAGVVVTAAHPAEAAWAEVEQRWLVPALTALRARKIARIELSVGAQRLVVGAARGWVAWRPFVRRALPWWEALATVDNHAP